MNGHGTITIWNSDGQEISYEYRGIGNDKVILVISFWKENENYMNEFQGEVAQLMSVDEALRIYQVLKTTNVNYQTIDKIFE